MPSKTQSIVLGGLVVAVLSTSYLSYINYLCCLGVILGTLLTVWHYTDTNEITIRAGDGAMMGVLSALIGVVVSGLVNYVLISMGIRHDLALAQFSLNMFGDSMSPEQIDQIEAQMNAEVSFGQFLLGIGIGSVVASIFGAIGGTIGAKVFKKGGDEPTEFDDLADETE